MKLIKYIINFKVPECDTNNEFKVNNICTLFSLVFNFLWTQSKTLNRNSR